MSSAEIEAVRELMGDPQRAHEDMQAFEENAICFIRTYPTLMESYPRKWVAVHDCAVKLSGDSIEDVLREIESTGLQRRPVYIGYVDPEPATMLL